MSLGVEGISELALEVQDLEAARTFWVQRLGLREIPRDDDARVIWLYAGGNSRLGLWSPRDRGGGEAAGSISNWPRLLDRGGSHVHFALYIEPARFDRAVDHLQGQGIDHRVEHWRGPGLSRSVYFVAPGGQVVELFTKDMRAAYGDG